MVKTRDWLMVRVICGATKAAVHTDYKKKSNKKRCRRKVRLDDRDRAEG